MKKLRPQMGGFKAWIKSSGYTLEGVKISEDGKKILLSVVIDFPFKNKSTVAPFIEIVQEIPN
jgi:hypothetical protein